MSIKIQGAGRLEEPTDSIRNAERLVRACKAAGMSMDDAISGAVRTAQSDAVRDDALVAQKRERVAVEKLAAMTTERDAAVANWRAEVASANNTINRLCAELAKAMGK